MPTFDWSLEVPVEVEYRITPGSTYPATRDEPASYGEIAEMTVTATIDGERVQIHESDVDARDWAVLCDALRDHDERRD